jgi:hypothetical protein
MKQHFTTRQVFGQVKADLTGNIFVNLNTIVFDIYVEAIKSKNQFGNLLIDFAVSGLTLFFTGELLGMPKFMVAGEIEEDLTRFVDHSI